MTMYKRILVGDNERVLVTRNKRFSNILEPGEYRIFTLLSNVEAEYFNIRDLVFASAWVDFIVKQRPEIAERYFIVVETSSVEVALVYADGKLVRVVAPGNRAAFWK